MKITWPTVAVLVAVLAFFGFLVKIGATAETVAMLAGPAAIVTAILPALFKRVPGDRDTPVDEHIPVHVIPDPPPTKPGGVDERGSSDVGPVLALLAFLGLVVAAAAVLALTGCGGEGAKFPAREVARAAVLGVAEGVRAADRVCANVAKAKQDATLADRCSQSYAVARSSVLAAAEGVDAYDAASEGQVRCTIARGATALGEMATAISTAGGDVPPVVVDALAFAKTLGAGGCS